MSTLAVDAHAELAGSKGPPALCRPLSQVCQWLLPVLPEDFKKKESQESMKRDREGFRYSPCSTLLHLVTEQAHSPQVRNMQCLFICTGESW